jgi:toxin ParE1/3/4
MGRVVPELANPAIREHFIYSYRVIYQVSGDDVQVLSVIHGRRLLDSAIADRL